MTKLNPEVREDASSFSGIAQRIGSLPVSESDRRIAEEALRSGELMADLIRRAGASLASAVELVSKSLPHRIR